MGDQETQSDQTHGSLPVKRILTMEDREAWTRSRSYAVLEGWLTMLNAAAMHTKRSAVSAPYGATIDGLLSLLGRCRQLIVDHPPLPGSMRYGNKAFRDWHAALTGLAATWIRETLSGEAVAAAADELAVYLLDSFGNSTRLDYGTGHELHFVIFLFCLFQLKVLGERDFAGLVAVVFSEYLEVARYLQVSYGLEPAGSRGVWCLDDYQFLPFYWGAAQLLGSREFPPSCVTNERLMAENSADYLYFGCIHYIHTHKKGPFFEHSPDLYNISGVTDWAKINRGMLLKYKDDVLSKFPVVQHMLFGSLFQYIQ